jgi:RHS repeat-associated protein
MAAAPNAVSIAFTYDAENRMITANSTITGVVTYQYDGDGRRVRKTVGSVTTTYVYDAMGQLTAEYGAPPTDSGTTYLTADHLGSTRFVSASDGSLKKCYDYLPFGEELQQGMGGRGSCYPANVTNPYPGAPDAESMKFTGQERDAETGLDYFGARYMSSAQGRFTSPDPSGLLSAKPADPQSWNLYAYVRNNPLVLIDPNGLDCVNATNNSGGFTVNHDTNSGDCGTSGGTWVPGYVNESWVKYNTKTDQYQVASIDAAGSYDPDSGFNSTIDYATFKAGAKTDENGKCVSGCKGYGFSSASTDWLESQLVGKSGLGGYLHFLADRDDSLRGGLLSQIAFGGLAFWRNHWAGPGGFGPPGGRGDWAASVHDFNYDQNGPIKISTYFNPTISPATAKALIQSNNMLIRNAGFGPQAGKFGLFFGAVNAFQFYVQSWK